MRFITHILPLTIVLAAMAGCSSDSTVTPIEDYVEQQPMSFSIATLDEGTGLSRATQQPLEAGFLVSTYKLYGAATQQTVMDRYEASYGKTTYHGSKWNTVGEAGVAPDYFYQTQYERYWDLSAFPYRFHAITPCPKQTTVNALITGFKLSDKELIIPKISSTIYKSQTSTNGKLNQDYIPDPYMIAQVERDANGVDWDLLQPQFEADGTLKATKTKISETTANFTRAVPLRFHHINSKVRFAIYTTVTNFPAESLTISNAKITATNPLGPWEGEFIYQYQGYTASLSNATDNFFDTGDLTNQRSETSYVLLDNTPNENKKTADLKDATSRDKAYFFDIPSTKVGEKADGTPIYDDITTESGTVTPGGLLQIPQKGVELYVEFDINNEHYSFQLEVNGKKTFDWRASCRYTYYIVVKHLVPFEIAFTATIEPWVTVTSSNIDTDLEQ